MKFMGNLKKKAENVQTKGEAGNAINKTGMRLNDDDLKAVSGGSLNTSMKFAEWDSSCEKSSTGKHDWMGRQGVYVCVCCRYVCNTPP